MDKILNRACDEDIIILSQIWAVFKYIYIYELSGLLW